MIRNIRDFLRNFFLLSIILSGVAAIGLILWFMLPLGGGNPYWTAIIGLMILGVIIVVA